MFDIGWSELVVIGIVALIVIGPRELPATLRTIGQAMTKLRRMASEFQGQLNDALREAELDELRKQAEKLTGEVTSTISNPIEKATSELQNIVDQPTPAETPAPAAPDPAPAAAEPAPEKIETPSVETAADSASSGGRPG
ncbi:MAG: twin-arginine translocase subunit TatB [Bradyrhizobiaceae bacterium]|nr:twin-arginine translocase subunit TatB [Bradyrhizobiaceae bacterium]